MSESKIPAHSAREKLPSRCTAAQRIFPLSASTSSILSGNGASISGFQSANLAWKLKARPLDSAATETLKGFREDCVKYNAAALMGITVLRYPTELVMSGDAINDVLEALK